MREKVIKQCLFGDGNKRTYRNPYFVRAVLGLTGRYSYRG